MNYPTQQEAELIVATKEALNKLLSYAAGAEDTICASLLRSTLIELQPSWDKVFCTPEFSPWEVKLKYGNLHVAWREGWN